MSDNNVPDTTDPATDDTTAPSDDQSQTTDAPATDEVSSNPGPWFV